MPLSVTRYELGPIGTNCYAVRASEDAAEAVVVDPSGDPARLLADVEAAGARVVAILVTHTHWDHLLGLGALVAATQAPVYAPREERERLSDPESAGHRARVEPHDPEQLVAGGDTLSVAGIHLEGVDGPRPTHRHPALPAHRPLLSRDLLLPRS